MWTMDVEVLPQKKLLQFCASFIPAMPVAVVRVGGVGWTGYMLRIEPYICCVGGIATGLSLTSP